MKKKHEVFLEKLWETIDEIYKEKGLSKDDIDKFLDDDSLVPTAEEIEWVKQIGGKIRSEREKKELSVEQLASLADLPVERVEKIEQGDTNCRITEVYDVADALGLALSVLVDGDKEKVL